MFFFGDGEAEGAVFKGLRECFPGAQQGDGLRFGDAVNEDLAFFRLREEESAGEKKSGKEWVMHVESGKRGLEIWE